MFLGHEKAQNWKHIDSSVRQQLSAWNEPALSLKDALLPHELFELFLRNTEMERICIESTNYNQLKGSHMFDMAVEKLKPFPRISGYAELPRQEMYRKRRKNHYNLVVSAIMTKMEFLESKQYLHLADNNALNSSDKFAKVRPLFNAINE